MPIFNEFPLFLIKVFFFFFFFIHFFLSYFFFTDDMDIISETNYGNENEKVYDFITFGAPAAHCFKFRTHLGEITQRFVLL